MVGWLVSRVHRLRTADRIFFITVNLRPALPPFVDGEHALVADALLESRRKLSFLLMARWWICPDAGPLARVGLDNLSAHHLASCSRYQMDCSEVAESESAHDGDSMAAPVLGSLRAPCRGVPAPAAVHAPEPGAQRAGC